MKDSSKEVPFGIYIPSYNRAEAITTLELVPSATLVVRESQKEIYQRSNPDTKIWAVEDSSINSLAKVRQYIIDNAPEDLIVQIDDDIGAFKYVNKTVAQLVPQDMVLTELMRIAQILYDLKLGFASVNVTLDTRKYQCEFQFKGIIGGVCWFNRKHLKSHYDEKTWAKEDTDFVLQELLNNRIIIVPAYFGMVALYDRNAGGNNDNKSIGRLRKTVEYMKQKWGGHYDHDFNSNQSKIKAKR